MARYTVKPTKPVAVFGAVFGAAILVFGVVTMSRKGNGGGFVWLWLVAGVAIIGFNLWAAFSQRGGVQTIESDDGPPTTRPGTTAHRDS